MHILWNCIVLFTKPPCYPFSVVELGSMNNTISHKTKWLWMKHALTSKNEMRAAGCMGCKGLWELGSSFEEWGWKSNWVLWMSSGSDGQKLYFSECRFWRSELTCMQKTYTCVHALTTVQHQCMALEGYSGKWLALWQHKKTKHLMWNSIQDKHNRHEMVWSRYYTC